MCTGYSKDIGSTPKMARGMFAIKVDGFSVSMTDFSAQYRDWVVKQKQSVKVAMSRWMRVYAKEVQTLARKNAPEFDEPGYQNNPNSLTNSIIATEVEDMGKNLRINVGVARSWNSTYEAWFMEKYDSTPPWGVSGPQLALFLHENWSSVAGKRALESAARKEARYGSIVGDRFLYRAAVEASDPRGLAVMAKRIFETTVGRYGQVSGSKFANMTIEKESVTL